MKRIIRNESKRSNSQADFRYKSNLLKSTCSQVTIFIIVAVVLVAAIILFFILFTKIKLEIFKPAITEPQAYMEKCAKDSALEAVEIMLPQGGYISPGNYKLYNDDKVAYLCYTNFFYRTCVMQEPLYIKHLEDEITTYITPKIEECFQSLKVELEDKKYNVEISNMQVKTELAGNIVRIKIDRILTLEINEEIRRFETFKSAFNSPLYNLAVVAQEIANQEARYCNFEYLGFMIFYPSFSIDKKSVGSGLEASKIYLIQDRYSGKKLNIAIRSCAIPAGF